MVQKTQRMSRIGMIVFVGMAVAGSVGNSRADLALLVDEMIAIHGGEVVYLELIGGGDPNDKLVGLTRFLDEMEDALADSTADAGIEARLNVVEPFNLQTSPLMGGSSELALHDGFGIVASGFADVVAYQNSGNVALVLQLTEGGVTRTLDQWFELAGGVLTSSGSLTIDDSVSCTTLVGGWSYDPVNGVVIDPGSDPGFVDELAAMLHVPDVPGRAFNLGTIFTVIGNVVSMVVNYIVDIFIPYTPPMVCNGPVINDAPHQSCGGVTIPCKDNLADACTMLDDLPGVSTAFKQCMKGRCDCGGSLFGRGIITCAHSTGCGPCSFVPEADGCSLTGSRIWYCASASVDTCRCVNIVFHEMSHGCGARDLQNGAPLDAYRIGDWFEDEFYARFPIECIPH